MLHYPSMNPIAFQIGSFPVHWYGLMYLLGFLAGWGLCLYRSRSSPENQKWTRDEIGDLIFYTALGVVLGGRLGYVLFYNLDYYLNYPLALFEVWRGGMAFHGGLLGALFALLLFSWRYKKPFLEVTDFLAPVVPIGLAAGRIGNFINGELWGRITSEPWGMVFPNAGPYLRHPSQLYEFFLEGIVLFILLWWYSSKPRARGAVSGMFLFFYGVFRIFCEFFREPDIQYGFLALDQLTMGQILSVPMVLAGLWLWIRARSVSH